MIYIAYSPYYNHPLPFGHRFPMDKYTMIPEQLLREDTFSEENFFEPELTDADNIISVVHSTEYIQKLKTKRLTKLEERRIGFPLSDELIQRESLICAGNVQAALLALDNGVSFNVAGGTHHAHRDFGEGYCLYNDIAVAAKHLLNKNKARKILVVDLDVHQGNGTASIFVNEPRVFTFSMHCENNFPLRKTKSDLDIPLKRYTDDHEYLGILEHYLPGLIETVKPDYMFYQSGVDILENDKIGKLRITKQGCLARDRIVMEIARRHQIPLAISMGGGYADNIQDIVDAHCNTYRVANEIYT